MTAYVTVQISMKDPDAFDAYRKVAGPALGKHGAKPISAGQAEVLDGDVEDAVDGVKVLVVDVDGVLAQKSGVHSLKTWLRNSLQWLRNLHLL